VYLSQSVNTKSRTSFEMSTYKGTKGEGVIQSLLDILSMIQGDDHSGFKFDEIFGVQKARPPNLCAALYTLLLVMSSAVQSNTGEENMDIILSYMKVFGNGAIGVSKLMSREAKKITDFYGLVDSEFVENMIKEEYPLDRSYYRDKGVDINRARMLKDLFVFLNSTINKPNIMLHMDLWVLGGGDSSFKKRSALFDIRYDIFYQFDECNKSDIRDRVIYLSVMLDKLGDEMLHWRHSLLRWMLLPCAMAFHRRLGSDSPLSLLNHEVFMMVVDMI
jgi:hypothetical protein